MDTFIDIETIPSQKEGVKEDIQIDPPGNMSKPETIAKWEAEKKPGLIEEEWRKTALNGTYGEIIAIGYALDDMEPKGFIRSLDEPESDLLLNFFADIHEALHMHEGDFRVPRWVGHYITGFDLRFIWQRCVINQVKPSIRIPYDAKPWADSVFDTKFEWTGLNQHGGGSLNDICKAMGYPRKGELDGSKVWDYVKDGRYQEVLEYCLEDVERTRYLYKRMTFEGQ